MPYRLTMTETPGDGLRRVAAEELQSAQDGLAAATPETRAKAVHEARKSIKKTRSLLRLSRSALGKRRFAEANVALRDTARTLSGTRDADVLVEVVEDLHERYVGQLPASAFDVLRTNVAKAALAPDPASSDDPLPGAIEGLAVVHAGVDAWPTGRATWNTVVDGLTRTYVLGLQDLDAIADDPDVEARHEWRKRVKDLWYQERLIAEAWEPVLNAHAEELHVLSEILGDDHDLAVLHETIRDGRVDAGPESDAILTLIDRCRDDLLDAALLLGRRIYAETPRAFAKRTAAYVEAWADTPAATVAA